LWAQGSEGLDIRLLLLSRGSLYGGCSSDLKVRDITARGIARGCTIGNAKGDYIHHAGDFVHDFLGDFIWEVFSFEFEVAQVHCQSKFWEQKFSGFGGI
jgi:hypothetical protein